MGNFYVEPIHLSFDPEKTFSENERFGNLYIIQKF